jgi:uncharacterized membrane protein YbhN (UPF0104 family)
MSIIQKNSKYFITGIFLIILIFFAAKFRQELIVIREISPLQILGMLCLAVLTVTINGSKLNQITRGFGISLKKREWFGLASINTTLNNVFFKAGSLVTSNYLKRKYDFPYMSFIGSLGADQLILLFINSLVGGILFFYLLAHNDTIEIWMGTLYLMTSVILFLIMKGKITFKNKKHLIWDALARILQSLKQILQNKKLFYSLCAHNGALLTAHSLRFFVICHILGQTVPLPYCFLFTTVVYFVSAVPMIQSDVGVRELSVGFLAELVGLGFNQGLLATIVDRVIVLLYTALLAGIFRNILLSSSHNKEQT